MDDAAEDLLFLCGDVVCSVIHPKPHITIRTDTSTVADSANT